MITQFPREYLYALSIERNISLADILTCVFCHSHVDEEREELEEVSFIMGADFSTLDESQDYKIYDISDCSH